VEKETTQKNKKLGREGRPKKGFIIKGSNQKGTGHKRYKKKRSTRKAPPKSGVSRGLTGKRMKKKKGGGRGRKNSRRVQQKKRG